MPDNNLQMYTQKELLGLLKVSRTTFWRMRKEEDFPEPVPFGESVKRWWGSEVEEWMKKRRA